MGFQSLFSLIAGVTNMCNDYFVVYMKQKGKKEKEPSNYSHPNKNSPNESRNLSVPQLPPL